MSRAAAAVTVVLAMLAMIVSTTVGRAAGQQPAANDGQRPVAGAEAAAVAIALDHVADTAAADGLSPGDISDVLVTGVVESSHNGATHVYLQQRHRGLEIVGASMAVTVARNGTVVTSNHGFRRDLAAVSPPISASITARQAVGAAAASLGLRQAAGTVELERSNRSDQLSQLSNAAVSRQPIPAKLVLTPRPDGRLALAWDLLIDEVGSDEWWNVRIDATTGRELERESLLAHDSYTVYDADTEAPSFGPRSTVVDPADPSASPFGWHDTDGVAGAESTLTIGNNVQAYADVDADNTPDSGSQPDGGASLIFDNPIDLLQPPASNNDALVVNLFYWNNLMHDTLYAYGFDESAGNFQTNNYGAGGIGADAVLAEARDGTGFNNANFATPPDGIAPRMQMFVWDAANPDRGSSLDNVVIGHEYAHGVSNRLTGGPQNVSCMNASETPSEGWSDYIGLWMTMQPGDTGTDARGIATYLLDQPPTGLGLRSHRYSTDMGVDPRTYDEIKTASIPHGVGSTFAAMLWDLHWQLVDDYGFDADRIAGTGGNNIALQLVIDGLKIQPCDPGFVDARDAILVADQLNNAGANECTIWEVFARRGLGWSADQGTSASRGDGTEAFDLPPHCRELQLTKTVAPTAASASVVQYQITATNNGDTLLTGIAVTDTVPAELDLLPASVSCSSSFIDPTLTINIASLAAGASSTCTYSARVVTPSSPVVLLDDDFEAGAGNWTAANPHGPTTWAVSSASPRSGANSMFAPNLSVVSDQTLELITGVSASSSTVLRFWHDYDLEFSWDGGVVEASTDGVNWIDLGAHFIEGGYDRVLSPSPNPLTSRSAFTGTSNGYVRSTIDLSSFAGSTVQVRFRLGTDSLVGANGWHIDDVTMTDQVTVTNVASATSAEGPADTTSANLEITGTALLRVTTSPARPSQITLDGVPMARWGVNWARVAPGEYELCFSDVAGWDTAPCEQIEVEPNQTTLASGPFAARGALRVQTSPALPATISIDGQPRNDWGVWTDVTPGLHQICFGEVADWTPPPCEDVTVVGGAPLLTVTGTYTSDLGAPGPSGHGLLRVRTSPPVPSQLTVNGVVRDRWGLNWVKVTPGVYEVCFGDVPGWAGPACDTTTVVAGQTSEVVGDFERQGTLRVTTSPAKPSTIYVDGHPRNAWGLWVDLPPGDHTVCFSEVDGHAPPCEIVTLTPGATTTTTGTWP